MIFLIVTTLVLRYRYIDPFVSLWFFIPPVPEGEGVYCFTSVRLSVRPSVHSSFHLSFRPSKIFFVAFFSVTVDGRNLIFLLPVCRHSWFLYTLNIYTHFCHIFLSNYWWQRSDFWSKASYRYPISWEVFLDPSDSYFLFVDFVYFYTHWTYIWYMPIFWTVRFLLPVCQRVGYHKWALAHSSSCSLYCL
jgi:hypothetical protein